MNSEELYNATLKMLSDKYNIDTYSKIKFLHIYKNLYNEKNQLTPTNEINKLVLSAIKNDIENNTTINIENRTKELEDLRENMKTFINNPKVSEYIYKSDITNNNIDNIDDFKNNLPQINILNNTTNDNNKKFKTFIIKTTKNSFNIDLNIDIKLHNIIPCCCCLPSYLKDITPYIMISISDNINSLNYIYIPEYTNKWDIWKPVIDNYYELNLLNNNINIKIYDYMNNLINFEENYISILDVLLVNNNYLVSVNNPLFFNINDKIKIITKENKIIDNIIINKTPDNKLIIINNLLYDDFINAKIYNYYNQFSLLFKYYSK